MLWSSGITQVEVPFTNRFDAPHALEPSEVRLREAAGRRRRKDIPPMIVASDTAEATIIIENPRAPGFKRRHNDLTLFRLSGGEPEMRSEGFLQFEPMLRGDLVLVFASKKPEGAQLLIPIDFQTGEDPWRITYSFEVRKQ